MPYRWLRLRLFLTPIVSTVCTLITAVLLLATFLRIAQYDGEGWLLALRYAAVWPLIAAGAAVLSVLARLCARTRLFKVAWVGSLLCGAISACTDWRFETPTAHEGPIVRCVYWNTAGPQSRLLKVIDQANLLKPDVLAVGEVGDDSPEADQLWPKSLKGYSVKRLPGEMLIATAGRLMRTSYGLLRRGRYNLVDFEMRGDPIRIIIVNLDAELTRSRQMPFEDLAAVAQRSSDLPVVVMGDFNTPADSLHFNLLKPYLRDAWADAGQGYRPSWPVPLPVLRIDHVWVGGQFRPIRCVQDWSLLSDHRAQIAELQLKKSPETPAHPAPLKDGPEEVP